MGIKRFHGWLMSQTDLAKVINLTDDGRSQNKQLVVDGWNLAYQMAQSDKTWTTEDTMFSNWKKMFAGVSKLADLFRRFSIDLVFFVDAWYEPSKLSEKKSRIAQQIEKHQALVRLFARRKKAHAVCTKCLDGLVNDSFGWSFEFLHALRNAGCTTYFTRGDADIAISQYVKSHRDVFGIFSTDTDFLAFNFNRVAIIRDLDSIQVERGTMNIRCWYPDDVWMKLGLSKSQKMRFIAFMGNDLVRGTARNVGDAVGKARNRKCKVSPPIVAALKKFYQIGSKSARQWEEQIGGRSKTEAFLMELNTNRRVKFQCEIGDGNVGAAPRLLRPLRRHLYHLLGIQQVEEVMFLPDANGQTELVHAEKSGKIQAIFDEVLELKDPGLDEVISAACDVLVVISPFDGDKTRFFCQMLRTQYRVIAKFPAVLNKLEQKVQRFMKCHAPLAEHLTMAHMFKRIVLIAHVLVGQQEMASISEWFYPPLCHFGLQQIDELNDVLSKMDCEGLGPIVKVGNSRANPIRCRKIRSHPNNSGCITPSRGNRVRRTRASSQRKPGRRGQQTSRHRNMQRIGMNPLTLRLPRFPGDGQRSNSCRSYRGGNRLYYGCWYDDYYDSDDNGTYNLEFSDGEDNDLFEYQDRVIDDYEKRSRKKSEARELKNFASKHF